MTRGHTTSVDRLTVHVFDADGVLLGSFGDEQEGHRFAHDQAAAPGARLPLEVEDRPERRVRFVWPGRCEPRQWLAVHRDEQCGLLPTPGVFGPWPPGSL